ncbi:hypothetical protein Hanom_Chr13g01190921 [Helianthus anomalus]
MRPGGLGHLVCRFISLGLAVWDAGVVMGRDAWDLNTRLMVYVHMAYETLNK